MHLGHFLDLFDRIAGVAFKRDHAHRSSRALYHVKRQVDLMLRLVLLLADRHFRLVESVLLHHALYPS